MARAHKTSKNQELPSHSLVTLKLHMTSPLKRTYICLLEN